MLSDVSFLNSRPLMLPVVQFSFAIFYPTIFRTLRSNACLKTVEVTLQKPLGGGGGGGWAL